MNDELEEVRQTLQDSTLFSPGVTAQIDAHRASVHQQLRDRGIDPSSEKNEEFELTWMVAGAAVGQLIASEQTTSMLNRLIQDVERGAIAAHLFWASGISPHPVEGRAAMIDKRVPSSMDAGLRRRELKVTSLDDVDAVIERYHLAAAEFVKGNPEPYKKLFSQREDVTVANPFGPVRRGWEQVAETMERASSLWKDGEVVGFENVTKCVTPDLAYIVEVERFKAKMGGSTEVTPVTLRTTSVLRLEDGTWKIVHRHADPITTARTTESVLQRES